MANLKLDLVNKINNKKYYKELELIRLAQEPNMNYEQKINSMELILRDITLVDGELGLMEQYFKEPVPQKGPTPVSQPTGKIHKGQSHGE